MQRRTALERDHARLDDLTRLVSNAQARPEFKPLMTRFGLNFGGVVKGNRRLVGGLMTFGEGWPPVPLAARVAQP